MAQDITSVQRDLADLQKQAKQLSDKIKNESDPTRKAILQKKLIDLNTKKANLNKEMEDLVTSIGVGQELEFAEGFTKWNKYKKSKVKKLTEQEKLKVKNFAKALQSKKLNEDERSKLSDFTDEDLAQLQKILSPIKHNVDKAFIIVNKYDTDGWNTVASNSASFLRDIYDILENFGINTSK